MVIKFLFPGFFLLKARCSKCLQNVIGIFLYCHDNIENFCQGLKGFLEIYSNIPIYCCFGRKWTRSDQNQMHRTKKKLQFE
jgi:hypothetical protein